MRRNHLLFFFFKHQGQSYCLDATDECAFGVRLGRLMNHGQGREENARVKILDLKSNLVFFDIGFHDTGFTTRSKTGTVELKPVCNVIYCLFNIKRDKKKV